MQKIQFAVTQHHSVIGFCSPSSLTQNSADVSGNFDAWAHTMSLPNGNANDAINRSDSTKNRRCLHDLEQKSDKSKQLPFSWSPTEKNTGLSQKMVEVREACVGRGGGGAMMCGGRANAQQQHANSRALSLSFRPSQGSCLSNCFAPRLFRP